VRVTVFPGLGKEWVEISGESRPGLAADEAGRELLDRFDGALHDFGLSLANVVRTRLWGRDREARDLGSKARVEVLAGKARSASSSYIAPSHFDSDGSVAIDLWALRPSSPVAEKFIQEYEPVIVPLRYLVYDGVVVLSGVTYEKEDLDGQLGNILPRISGSLADAGSSWDNVARMSCHLHRSQQIDHLRTLLAKHLGDGFPEQVAEYAFADGYSSLGKLIEIEVTATR
jgi:enamine deaminase RidA (YjgF/YER057c/UK114 family)